MNKLLAFILISAVFSFSCKREKKGIDNIFSKYEGQDGVYMIKLPPELFLTFIQKNKNVTDISFDNVDLVRYMVINRTESSNLDKTILLKKIISELDGLLFEELLMYSKSGNEVIVRILDTGEYISDLIVLVNDNESLMMIGISGKMEIDDITKLASEIDYKSFKGIQIN